MLLEAIIFDVDGTLAETEEAHRQSFNEAFASLGFDWSWNKALYRKLLQITGGKERIQYFLDHCNPPGAERARARFTEIYELASKRYEGLVTAGAAVPRPGIIRLIKEARERGVRLAIATTSARNNVDVLLCAMLGEEGAAWFSVIAAGDIVAHKKPAPDVYLYALEKLACDMRFCIAIEDSENGVKAARAAGLAVIAAPSHYLSGDNLSAAQTVLSDLGEPSHSFHYVKGPRLGRDYVDIDGLDAWLKECNESRASARGAKRSITERSVPM